MREGTELWRPTSSYIEGTNITLFMGWLRDHRGLTFTNYQDLWNWSVTDLEGFWGSIWAFYGIEASRPYTRVLDERRMPGAKWFEGARLNFAQHLMRYSSSARPALVFKREDRAPVTISWAELSEKVARMAGALTLHGVRPGDRVGAYLPNCPEAVVAFLATASVGAVWSSCSPEFGSRGVVDRLKQIEPKVLFAVDGYSYGGRVFDRREVVSQIKAELSTLEHLIDVPYMTGESSDAKRSLWDEWLSEKPRFDFEQVPADHPLWILYTSGTSGMPKGIVHGHAGILVASLVTAGLHMDLRADDRFFWFTTTGWVMWNVLVSGLLFGATPVLYDGSPVYPKQGALWALAEETRATWFGTSAAYLSSSAKSDLTPGNTYDLSRLRALCYTGSPLAPEHYSWVYEAVSKDVWFSSVSGGTDVCGAFLGGCPNLPVFAGELQCRCLGAKVEAWDRSGEAVVDEVGELVVTEPLPSMPLRLWNDPDGNRYHASYFDVYPGVWRHGDWIKITSRGTAVIYGRSDATINRLGVRIGSSEIYRVVEELPEIVDSLVVDLTALGRDDWMPLFVVLRDGIVLDDALEQRIRERLRTALSPRHVPDAIYAVPVVPRTLNNKKLELPVKRVLAGARVEEAVNLDSTLDPRAMDFYMALARQLREREAQLSGGTHAGKNDGGSNVDA